MKVSVNAVWDDTLAFVRAERKLVVPLALGTIYFAAVFLLLAALSAPPAGRNVAMILAGGWSIVGQLALADLTRGGGRSVREALGVALRRLPWALLVYVAVMLLFTALFWPVVTAMLRLGYTMDQLVVLFADPAKSRAMMMALPSWTSFYMLAVSAVALFLFVRLILWKAALVDTGRLVPAFKASWQATRGKFWALLGLVLLTFILIQLVTLALTSGLGTLFLLVGQSLGSPIIAQLIPALLVALVMTAIQAMIALFLALFYRRATTH
jgi:hypothetical protein